MVCPTARHCGVTFSIRLILQCSTDLISSLPFSLWVFLHTPLDVISPAQNKVALCAISYPIFSTPWFLQLDKLSLGEQLVHSRIHSFPWNSSNFPVHFFPYSLLEKTRNGDCMIGLNSLIFFLKLFASQPLNCSFCPSKYSQN